jgi:hypothetical protein
MRELGDGREVARKLAHLAAVSIDQREHARARGLLVESLTMARELDDARVVIDGLETCAYLAVVGDMTDRAARLHGAAEALRETIGVPLSPSERALDEVTMLTAVRAALGEETFTAAWAEGRAMSMERAIAYALEGSRSA